MNVVITMSGLGSRFQKAGFKKPKYMIVAKGRTLFEWSMKSLEAFFYNHFIFIVQRKDQSIDFINKKCILLGIKKYDIIEIDYLTNGQAATALLAEKTWEESEPILIYNIDTFISNQQLKPEKIKGDGFIPCFPGNGNHWSFVKLNTAGNAIEVREKDRISNCCSIGAYYFKSCTVYKNIYNQLYVQKKYLEHGEEYIAPMYNELIKTGYIVKIQMIDSKYVHVLGTPEELKAFENS